MNESPFFSIIIPARNGERSLARCLESIKRQTYPVNKYEIIISDGMSTDDTVKIAEDFGSKIVKNTKLTVNLPCSEKNTIFSGRGNRCTRQPEATFIPLRVW
jgi:glycosyltransferase involved in cell wall biosynthesis